MLASHTANDSSIQLEALLGVIIIVVCILYVFLWDKIHAAIRKRRENKSD